MVLMLKILRFEQSFFNNFTSSSIFARGMKLPNFHSSCSCNLLANVIVILLSAYRVFSSTCSTVRHIGWERDELDCTYFYMCHLGRKMGNSNNCPDDKVWSIVRKRCVRKASKYNDCECTGKTSFSSCVKYPCTGAFLIEYRSDVEDCNRYHVCYRGVSVNVLQCPDGKSWSTTEGKCSKYSPCGRDRTSSSPYTTPTSRRSTTKRAKRPPIRPTRRTTTRSPTTTRSATTKEANIWPKWFKEHMEPPRPDPPTTTTMDPTSVTVRKIEDCGIIATSYIVGGTPAFEGEWPWQILLKGRINATHETQCGGVLINRRWVLTAAHCVFRNALHHPSAWTVVLGEHATTYSTGRERVVRPDKIIRHDGYEPRGGFPNDIALMQLPEDVYVEERFIMPVCLPPADFVIPEHSHCWITGWGNTDTDGHGAEVLNSLSVNVWSRKQCQMAWGNHITTEHICVGTGDTGACAGDSGGPLSCEINGRFVVAGIASWGVPGCRTPGYPDVYTNVTAYLDWVRESVASEDDTAWDPTR